MIIDKNFIYWSVYFVQLFFIEDSIDYIICILISLDDKFFKYCYEKLRCEICLYLFLQVLRVENIIFFILGLLDFKIFVFYGFSVFNKFKERKKKGEKQRLNQDEIIFYIR